MEKEIDRIAEIKDLKEFFPEGQVSEFLENCYIVTFPQKSEVSISAIDYWECNGFELVGFGVNDDKKLTVTVNVSQRRIMQGTVEVVLVVQ
jgi:hypothetical protein